MKELHDMLLEDGFSDSELVMLRGAGLVVPDLYWHTQARQRDAVQRFSRRLLPSLRGIGKERPKCCIAAADFTEGGE